MPANDRGRRMEVRRMELQAMQYRVAVESGLLEVEELKDRICGVEERVRKTLEQASDLDTKLVAARTALEVENG